MPVAPGARVRDAGVGPPETASSAGVALAIDTVAPVTGHAPRFARVTVAVAGSAPTTGESGS